MRLRFTLSSPARTSCCDECWNRYLHGEGHRGSTTWELGAQQEIRMGCNVYFELWMQWEGTRTRVPLHPEEAVQGIHARHQPLNLTENLFGVFTQSAGTRWVLFAREGLVWKRRAELDGLIPLQFSQDGSRLWACQSHTLGAVLGTSGRFESLCRRASEDAGQLHVLPDERGAVSLDWLPMPRTERRARFAGFPRLVGPEDPAQAPLTSGPVLPATRARACLWVYDFASGEHFRCIEGSHELQDMPAWLREFEVGMPGAGSQLQETSWLRLQRER